MRPCLLPLLGLLAALSPAAERPAFDPALADRAWLLEAVRYSYYWYLDDAFFAATQADPEIAVWVRSVEPHQRDQGDRSRFAEVWLPQARILLSLKKADYDIAELNLPVRSGGYRVVRGSYEAAALGEPEEWRRLAFPREELLAELTASRGHLHVPPPATKALALAALRREFARAGGVTGPQTAYIAARTEVSSQVWIYWLEQRTLLLLAGDMDAVDPALVARLPLLVRRFPLGTNVVSSTLEAGGRNAHISRDLASRALFVCLARGESVQVEP